MQKILNIYKRKTAIIQLIIAGLFAILYAVLKPPFYLHFIDGLTMISVVYILIGMIRLQWISGDLAIFSYRKDEGSYRAYKQRTIEGHKDEKNTILAVGILLLIIAILLALFY